MTANLSKNFSAVCILAAGVGAAMHIGKLPPSLPVLGQVLGVTLLEAGFLLSSMQMAGMLLGLMTGLAVQRVGLKRSMILGLLLVALGSALGTLAQSAAWLLATRAMEGLGFLWVVLPAPALLRQSVGLQRVTRVMGLWGAYMPLGTSLGLLFGPYVMHLALPDMGWRVWWGVLSGWCALLALLVLWLVPTDVRPATLSAPNQKILSLTLRSGPAWLLALSFAAYSGQWLAVVGFLPTIYARSQYRGQCGGRASARARCAPTDAAAYSVCRDGAGGCAGIYAPAGCAFAIRRRAGLFSPWRADSRDFVQPVGPLGTQPGGGVEHCRLDPAVVGHRAIHRTAPGGLACRTGGRLAVDWRGLRCVLRGGCAAGRCHSPRA